MLEDSRWQQYWLWCAPGQNASRGADIGNIAPDFRLDNLDGQPVSLSDFRGRPVLLNFWASWCPPCREEMPLFQDIFTDEKWTDKGLAVLAIDIVESPATVSEFVKEYGLAFPVLLDTTRDVSLEYHVNTIPATLFIDRYGVIREIRIGAFTGKPELERSLQKIMR